MSVRAAVRLARAAARLARAAAGLTTAAALVAPLAAAAAPLAAQEQVLDLAAACAVGDVSLEDPCLETVLAVQAARGLVGVAAAGGAAFPGSASTLGKRFEGRPRFGFSLTGGFVDAPLPAFPAPASGSAAEEGAVVPAVQGAVAAGVFQGFSTAPTMGGILSLDLLGTFSWVDLPGDRGFRGSATGLGVGARVGVFRESFTLPGITLSATRRWMGQVSLAGAGDEGTRADLDVTATSLRGTVGKTLAAVDVLAGFGWDRYAGEVDLTVRPAGSGGPEGSASADDFRSDRILLYAGAGYTFLVYQLSGEVGWARGFDAPPGREGAGYHPDSGTPFLRLGFRLTY